MEEGERNDESNKNGLQCRKIKELCSQHCIIFYLLSLCPPLPLLRIYQVLDSLPSICMLYLFKFSQLPRMYISLTPLKISEALTLARLGECHTVNARSRLDFMLIRFQNCLLHVHNTVLLLQYNNY